MNLSIFFNLLNNCKRNERKYIENKLILYKKYPQTNPYFLLISHTIFSNNPV